MSGARRIATFGLLGVACVVAGCATPPPSQHGNLCAVFGQYPSWYDYAEKAEKRWGTPKHIQLAFVQQESSFRSNAKPPFRWFLFIPLGRASSAKGYAQAQDAVWDEYQAERGSLFRSRGDMEDALDFIGWYNHNSHRRLGISKGDARNLYLAYHEGHGGYRRGSHKKKPSLLRVAEKVARRAGRYSAQLNACGSNFRCRKLWQIGPLCS
ncbi:MAG: hypothetical protein HKP27_11810 [Myxococcales bacterium]|nr:hypothetical protein [Myxococcales bacterium]